MTGSTKIITIFLGIFLYSTTATAALIYTFTPDRYLQSGTVVNHSKDIMIGFQIDFVVDSGTPASAIWDISSAGAPNVTYSNLINGGAFTATWTGLNIVNGAWFNYVGLDYDGFNGVGPQDSLIPPLKGEEVITAVFANTGSFSGVLPAVAAHTVPVINVFGPTPEVPEPSTLAIFALGVIGLASRRFKKQF